MAEQISETIIKKLKKICKDPNGESDEFKIILELLEKTSRNDKQTKAVQVKKEFQLLADQYFSYQENKNE
jgi:hypothetical protein